MDNESGNRIRVSIDRLTRAVDWIGGLLLIGMTVTFVWKLLDKIDFLGF